jgi:hypothetical protein
MDEGLSRARSRGNGVHREPSGPISRGLLGCPARPQSENESVSKREIEDVLRDAEPQAGSVSVTVVPRAGPGAEARARGLPWEGGPHSCVFCQRANQPMTREHVFARWLIRQVHAGRLVPTAASLPGTPSSTAPMRIARVTAGVCAECNAGWMSTLEVSFRRTLFARPRVGLLRAPDRITLSRWFTKTAVLLAHAHRGALRAADPPQLLSGMPDHIEVFLARRRRPRQQLDFALNVIADRDAAPLMVRSVAILVDDLVGHVAPRGTLASRHGTRLWPLRSHTLRWETLPVITSPIARADEGRSAKRPGI